MKSRERIEVLARGACVRDGMLLACRSKGAANTYLPGGHVEFGETAMKGLIREIREELGIRVRVGRFLGGVEHTFVQRGERHCEINLVFEMKAARLLTTTKPVSREKHIGFEWLPLKGLRNSDLEPAPLRKLLAGWMGEVCMTNRWASTFGEHRGSGR